ncbi:MAG: tryptophan-rich sensory protein [Pirellulaceae bacterium]|nr:tryptophan-rich sensory protein [Pirellulaceae bacterium]
MQTSHSKTTWQKWGGLAVWLVICFSASAMGAIFPVGDWYAQLNRPSFAPPNAIFGPVWTLLYLSMAISAWLVWQSGSRQETLLPLAIFMAQLALNAVWSWLFFGIHRMDWAFLDIILLLVAIGVTIVLFYRCHRMAGFLLIPYFCWVAFATALNFGFWRLNV